MKQLFLLLSLLLAFTRAQAQDPGDVFFAEPVVHEIRFQFNQPGYWDSLKANYTLDVYMRCQVTVDGTLFPESGVKYKGNSSYNNSSKKKPFRIDFEEYGLNQEIDGLSKLVLNNAFKDPTLLREKLMLDFLNDHGIAAPRATFARLYVNDHYWGVYTVVEDIGKPFLKDRFGNKGGNVFKGDPKGSLMWKGWDQALYQTDYELKTNETANDWTDLIRFVNALNNTPPAQLADSLGKYLNLDSWYAYWAGHNLFVNLDSYIGSGHNYYLYHNTDTDKFEWITWDVNEAFGNFSMGLSLANVKTLSYAFVPQPGNSRPMMNKILPDAALKQGYVNRLCDLLDNFTNANLDPKIDALANLIRPYVYADSLKFFPNNQFEQNLSQDLNTPVPGAQGIAGLKPFITARHTALQTQLASQGCTLTGVGEAGALAPTVFPNPANAAVTVTMGNAVSATVQLVRADGQRVSAPVTQTVAGFRVETAGLPAGIYFLTVNTSNSTGTARLIISH